MKSKRTIGGFLEPLMYFTTVGEENTSPESCCAPAMTDGERGRRSRPVTREPRHEAGGSLRQRLRAAQVGEQVAHLLVAQVFQRLFRHHRTIGLAHVIDLA